MLARYQMADVEDALQDAYLLMFRYWTVLDNPEKRDSWVAQVVFRSGLQWLRRNRQGVRPLCDLFAEVPATAAVLIPNFEHLMDCQSAAETIKEYWPELYVYGITQSREVALPKVKTLAARKSVIFRSKQKARRKVTLPWRKKVA